MSSSAFAPSDPPLSAAGFRAIEVHTPTLPETYEGADAERMQVERTHPPYAIYVAQK
ncbi:MAG TPA: hypothetical protein VNO21_00090 [Polyangiaceae bacterium]|nr:hypothetical protein [Polyangiaceae bacterium]